MINRQNNKHLRKKAMGKRSLYQCFHAKVNGSRIYCARGRSFGMRADDGTIEAVRLARGAPLELSVCQNCPDYDEMGPPVPREERGWPRLSPIRKKTPSRNWNQARRLPCAP